MGLWNLYKAWIKLQEANQSFWVRCFRLYQVYLVSPWANLLVSDIQPKESPGKLKKTKFLCEVRTKNKEVLEAKATSALSKLEAGCRHSERSNWHYTSPSGQKEPLKSGSRLFELTFKLYPIHLRVVKSGPISLLKLGAWPWSHISKSIYERLVWRSAEEIFTSVRQWLYTWGAEETCSH